MALFTLDYENPLDFEDRKNMRVWAWEIEGLSDGDEILFSNLAATGDDKAIFIEATDATTYNYLARTGIVGFADIPYAMGGSTDDQTGNGGGTIDNTIPHMLINIKTADGTTAGTTDKVKVALTAYTRF